MPMLLSTLSLITLAPTCVVAMVQFPPLENIATNALRGTHTWGSHPAHPPGQEESMIAGRIDLGFSWGVARIYPTIGTPPQGPVDAVFDLGSTDNWVVSKNCEVSELPLEGSYCPSLPIANGTNACPLQAGSFSSTQSSTWTSSCDDGCLCLPYLAGWAMGSKGEDIWQLGAGNKTPFGMGVISYEQASFSRVETDAIVGLAFPGLASVTKSTVASKSQDGYFTFCLPQCEDGKPGSGSCQPSSYNTSGSYTGFVCFGCEDICDAIEGQDDLPWVQSSKLMRYNGREYLWWWLELSSFVVLGGTYSLDMCIDGGCADGAILDSGVALLCLPDLWASAFLDSLRKAIQYGEKICARIPAEPVQGVPTLAMRCLSANVTEWPSLSFTLGGVSLTLEPKYYVRAQNGTTEAVIQLESSTQTILGAAFLNAFYTRFNVKEHRVAFKGNGVHRS